MASRRSEATRADVAGVDLPTDVLYDILLRVQARPLSRFRAVCKSWRSLLSDDPRFAAAHAALHQGDPPLLAVCVAVGSRGDAAVINLLDTTSGRVVKRVGTGPSAALLRQVRPHHGLVLLTRRLGEVLSVLDPATGATSLLPDDGGYESSFAFGRAAPSSGGGAGEYKVLRLSRIPLVYKILTVDGGGNGGCHGGWRDVPTEPPIEIKRFHGTNTTAAGGVVYHLVADLGGWTMAAFDLAEEEWRPDLVQGPVPEPSSGDSTSRRLAEVNGRLAAVSTTVSTMDVWLLMGGGAGEEEALWWKRCRVVTTSILRRHGLFADAEPVWVLEDVREGCCLGVLQSPYGACRAVDV